MADPDEEDVGSRTVVDNQSTRPPLPPPYRPLEPLAAQLPTSINRVPTIPTIPAGVEDIKADIVKGEEEENASDTETLNSADLVLSSEDEASEVDGSVEKTPGAGGELPPLKNSSFMKRKIDSPTPAAVEVVPPSPHRVDDKVPTVVLDVLVDDDENVDQNKPQVTIVQSLMDAPVPCLVSMEESESAIDMAADVDCEELGRSESTESLMSRLVRQLLCCSAEGGAGTSAALDPIIRQQVDDELRRRYYTGI